MSDEPINDPHDWENASVVRVNLVPARMVLEKNLELMKRDAEIESLRSSLAEKDAEMERLRKDAEIATNALKSLKSQHAALREAVERGKGCCCERCIEDIAAEVAAWRRDAERWKECERRAGYPRYSDGEDYIIREVKWGDTFAAAIDAAIEARAKETKNQ